MIGGSPSSRVMELGAGKRRAGKTERVGVNHNDSRKVSYMQQKKPARRKAGRCTAFLG